MYKVYIIEYYKIYDAKFNEFVDYFYSKEELVKFISKWYYKIDNEIRNSFIDKCTCIENELMSFPNYRCYMIFDNYDRIINIKDFEQDSWDFFQKNGEQFIFYNESLWERQIKRRRAVKKKFFHTYEYRKDPVPYTRKIRGGSWWSSPHTAGIIRMYKNPEHKRFNRGSWHGVPSWWDDRSRRVQKSWKEQTKNKYQWEKNLK